MALALDLPTLAALTLAGSLLLPSAILAARLVGGRVPGINEWLLASVSFVAGFGLIMLQGRIPDILALVVGNTLVVVGEATLAVGCHRFFHRPVRRRWEMMLGIAIAVLMAWFTFWEPNRSARVVFVSLGLAGSAAAAAWAVLPAARGDRTITRRVLFGIGGLMLLAAVAMFGRAMLNVGVAFGEPASDLVTAMESLHLLVGTVTNLGIAAALPLLVSQRVAAQLLESRRRLERIHEVGLLGFLEVEFPSGTAHPNPVYERIFGVTPDMPRSAAQWLRMIHPDDLPLAQQRIRDFNTPGVPLAPIEYRIHRGTDKQVRWIWSTSERETDITGKTTHVSTIIVDITERKEAELAMRRAHEATEAASRAKTEFLANMSHELRTPLHGVLGNAQLLAGTTLDDDQRLCVGGILGSAESLLKLVNDVLDHASLDAGTFQIAAVPVDLPTLLHRLEREFAPAAQAKGLRLDVAPLPAALTGSWTSDPQRLYQVLAALISNGIKFSTQGEVRVEVGVMDVLAQPPAGGLRFVVKDTGCGIAPAAMDKLFTPFFQADSTLSRSHGGAGLGLSLAKRLVERMGGRIDVTSEPGVGSAFSVALPCQPASAPSSPGDVEFDPVALTRHTDGDSELARSIAANAAADLRAGLAALDAAVDKRNWKSAMGEAQDLRTIAAPLGAGSLCARLKALERDFSANASPERTTLSIPRDTILALADAAERWSSASR